MTMPFRPPWYFFVALVSITFIGPLSIHLIIPAMPAVKEAFGVSTGMAQLTLSVEMLSMACFTVAYGGLSDRFGRKRVLLSVLVLFTFGAASCVAATNLPMLLAGRILQGAGAGCGVVLAREQRWEEMPGQISDEVMHTFAVVGTHEEIADKIVGRYGGVLDQVGFSIAVENEADAEKLKGMIRRIHAG